MENPLFRPASSLRYLRPWGWGLGVWRNRLFRDPPRRDRLPPGWRRRSHFGRGIMKYNLLSRAIGLTALAFSAFGIGAAFAEGIAGAPAPFDKGGVKVALISYISAGDFFQAYQAGAEAQAKALGIDLRIFPGRQDAAEERDQLQQAINLGVQGIIIDHGLPESLKDVAQQALDAGV